MSKPNYSTDVKLKYACNMNHMCLFNILTHWGRVTHICVGNLTIIGSDNGLSPYRRQAIIWTNAGILLIGPLRTKFSEILIGIQTFSFKKMHLKVSSAKWRSCCLGLNVLRFLQNGRLCAHFIFKRISVSEIICFLFKSQWSRNNPLP